VCGTPVRAENLARHLASVHPREATSQMVKEAKQAGEEKAAASKPRTRSLRTRPSWRVPVAVILILLLAGGVYVVATNPIGKYNANTPVLEMCIEHSQISPEWHNHAFLHIYISGSLYAIPADVGRPPGSPCMRPVHTHTADGEIHVETPVPHEFTLRDFFLVWGQPFSSSQIFGYSSGGGHTITMTVNSVSNNEFENFVFPHTSNPASTVIEIRYQ